MEPSIAYQPLSEPDHSIRLIKLHPMVPDETAGGSSDNRDILVCDIVAHLRADCPSYTALSYVWAAPGMVKEYIMADGREIPISKTVENALRRLRFHNKVRWLWVDQLCINQTDEVEKSHQVHQMHNIYKDADQVIAWLGPADESSDLICSLMRETGRALRNSDFETLSRLYSGDGQQGSVDLDVAKEAFDRFCQRRYWTRIWVMQEFAVGRRVSIACGNWIVKSDLITATLYATSIIQKHVRKKPIRDLGTLQQNLELVYDSLHSSYVYNLFSRRRRFHQQVSVDSGPETEPLLKVVATCLALEVDYNWVHASDPRDRIFALLNLAGDRDHFTAFPDYTMSVEEVYEETARKILQQGRIDVLMYCQSPKKIKSLPSWVPDWSMEIRHPCAQPPWGTPFEASGTNTSIPTFTEGGLATLEGIHVDKIRETGATWDPNWLEPVDRTAVSPYLKSIRAFCDRSPRIRVGDEQSDAGRIAVLDGPLWSYTFPYSEWPSAFAAGFEEVSTIPKTGNLKENGIDGADSSTPADSRHAAYVQFQDCRDIDASNLSDSRNPQMTPESFRASVNTISDAIELTVSLIGTLPDVSHNYCLSSNEAAFSTGIVPNFTVLDFLGQHNYAGRVINSSCNMLDTGGARLRLEITSTFNQSAILDTFDTTLELATIDGNALTCARASLTPQVRRWIQLLSFWMPVIAFCMAVIVALWSVQAQGRCYTCSDLRGMNHDYSVARVADALAYIQFIFLSGALSLRYPGFFQPLVASSGWSTLMLPAGPVSRSSPYKGVRDGIYETNGTMTGAPGLELLTQLTASPVKSESWFNTLTFTMMVLLFLCVSVCVRDRIHRRKTCLQNQENSSPGLLYWIKRPSWAVARLFLSYFLLPLSAWSTYQFSDIGLVRLHNSSMAIVVFMILLLSFWWSWSQADSKSDFGLFVVPGPPRRGKHAKNGAALMIFSLMLLRGIVIGGFQAHPDAQAGILLGCELIHLVSMPYWIGFSFLSSLPGTLSVARLALLSLHLGFLPGVSTASQTSLLGFIILSGHLAVLVGIFLVPITLRCVQLALGAGRNNAMELTALRSSARGISLESEPGRSTQDAPGQILSLESQDYHKYLAHRIMNREFKALLGDYEDGGKSIDLAGFLKSVQGEDIGSKLTRFSPGLCDQTEAKVSISDLLELLLSKENSALQEEPASYVLGRPINEYFISSSHNTYLSGRQVIARSTIQGYISALSRGCRCIEVDCWDGRDGQPIVKHGYSLTTRISFRDVMETIKQYAFVCSDFPLWISLEVHCTAQQRNVMARTMRESFGSCLVTEPLPGFSQSLPSPSHLKGRILIKTKVLPDTDPYEETQEREKSGSVSRGTDSSSDELAKLAVYGAGKKLPPWGQLDTERAFIYSVSETNLKSRLKGQNTRSSVGPFHNQHMIRVYPDATRIDSSNLSPLRFWPYGVQMVAVNYQTNGLSLELNSAMFAGGTDVSGYVLKPENPVRREELRIVVDVIMAKELSWPSSHASNLGAYVEMEILIADGNKNDAHEATTTSRSKARTRSIPPRRQEVLFDQSLDFVVNTNYPSLVFLRWSINTTSDTQGYPRTTTVGSGVAKVARLKKGYRVLPLKKRFEDNEDCGYLFCKIELRDTVARRT
ncbi:hypothetical protein ACJZ2D_009242 [Fusarium nematophilum]